MNVTTQTELDQALEPRITIHTYRESIPLTPAEARALGHQLIADAERLQSLRAIAETAINEHDLSDGQISHLLHAMRQIAQEKRPWEPRTAPSSHDFARTYQTPPARRSS